MKVSYDWLQTYFETYLPRADKLEELFSAHAFEVEGVEVIARDTVFDIKVLPDRAHYALCHRGIAYEASAITGFPFKAIKEVSIKTDSHISAPDVRVQDAELCRRYVALRVNNIHVTESPKEIREKLEAIGARSINTIVDATNFVMFDIGQPLHAFDADKVRGAIFVRLAKKAEKIVLLDSREVELSETDLVIADDEGPLAIAGVKGGKRAEVTMATKNIIIESANFQPRTVRRTSTRLNLRNDSSKRFENEITPVLAYEAIERVTKLILELSKGAKVGLITDIYSNPTKPWRIEVSREHVSKIIGIEIPRHDFERILTALRFSFKFVDGKYEVHVPEDRLDIKIPEDIADEVGRMIGYDKLPAKQTLNIEPIPVDKTFYYAEKVKNILVGLGFSEVQTYSLVPKGYFEIAYPLASDKSALRENLKTKVIDSLEINSRNADLLGLDTIKIFEIGNTFEEGREKTSMFIGVSQVKKKKGVTTEKIVQEALINIGNVLGIIAANVEVGNYGAMIEADFSHIVSKLPDPTSIKDLNFKPLSRDIKYKPFSHYPFIVRDIAFFAPSGTDETKARAVVFDSARASSGNLLIKGPDIFDKFQKGEKVSFAFRMIFQSFERTLSDDEVNVIMDKVYGAVKENGWEVR